MQLITFSEKHNVKKHACLNPGKVLASGERRSLVEALILKAQVLLVLWKNFIAFYGQPILCVVLTFRQFFDAKCVCYRQLSELTLSHFKFKWLMPCKDQFTQVIEKVLFCNPVRFKLWNLVGTWEATQDRITKQNMNSNIRRKSGKEIQKL